MRNVELLERSGGVWRCVICGSPLGEKEPKAQARIGPHVDGHFAKLKESPSRSGGGSSSGGGGGGFLDFVGDIIDAIAGY